MRCDPKCHWSAALDEAGNRLMISAGGKSKFPLNTIHPMCPECQKALLEEAELGVLFNNDQKAISRYKKMKNGAKN